MILFFNAWPWRHKKAPRVPAARGVVPIPPSPISPTSPVAMTRDLGRAREAFAKRGFAASRAAHDGRGSSSSMATTSTLSITTSCSSASDEVSSGDLMPTREIMIGAPDGASCAPEDHSNTPSEYIKSMVRVRRIHSPQDAMHPPQAACQQVSRR